MRLKLTEPTSGQVQAGNNKIVDCWASWLIDATKKTHKKDEAELEKHTHAGQVPVPYLSVSLTSPILLVLFFFVMLRTTFTSQLDFSSSMVQQKWKARRKSQHYSVRKSLAETAIHFGFTLNSKSTIGACLACRIYLVEKIILSAKGKQDFSFSWQVFFSLSKFHRCLQCHFWIKQIVMGLGRHWLKEKYNFSCFTISSR